MAEILEGGGSSILKTEARGSQVSDPVWATQQDPAPKSQLQTTLEGVLVTFLITVTKHLTRAT